jgi:hypothetical protein
MIDLTPYQDRYSNLGLRQAMKTSWRRMKAVLFRRYRVRRFLYFALLGFLSNLNGGSKHVELLLGPLPLPLMLIGMSMYDDGAYLLAFALSAVIIWVFFEARFRLIYLRSIADQRICFLKSWKELKVPGRSFFRWEAIVSLLLAGNLISMFLLPWWLVDYDLDMNPFFFPAMFSSLLFLALIDFWARRLILPLMCIKNIKFVEAFRLFLRLYEGDKKPFLAYFFAALGIHAAIVVVFLVVSAVLTFATYLIQDFFPYLYGFEAIIFYLVLKMFFSIVMLPLQMWYQGWGLAFYGGFGEDLKVLED